MDKLLIVDGMNLYFQMYCGMPTRIVNKDGKGIHGTLGFVGALIKIIKMVNPTHAVVLFDCEHENDRAAFLPDYKANRTCNPDEVEDDSYVQIYDVYEALTFMNIKHAEIKDFEADDGIASYVLTYSGDMEIIISSNDSDFYQLINENVQMLRYRGVKTIICDSQFLLGKYGIKPCQYADFKSLTGDNSDNIKGAKGVGPKTASALIKQFGSLEEILKNTDKIARVSIREAIIRNAERLQINYKLIKLKNRANLPFALNELSYTYNGVTTNEVLKGINLR